MVVFLNSEWYIKALPRLIPSEWPGRARDARPCRVNFVIFRPVAFSDSMALVNVSGMFFPHSTLQPAIVTWSA